MRNLKRALSLTLASVMLLGMMVVGSSAAAGYSDVDENDNVEAIEVLQAIEVMVGDDRGFGPDRPVTRNEMAVVMGKLLNLNYNYYASSCPFTDVADWAKGWVGACAANGIVSGRGNGIYDGESTVTAIEAASMMMRALGYFKNVEDYADGFQVVTVRQGSEIGIFNDVGTDATTPMTRNQVAQMALNALQANMVDFTGTLGIDVNGVKVGYRAEYTFRSGTDRKYFAISSQGNTTDGTTNQAYIQLGEQLYDGDLRLYDDETDDFGRPSRQWDYNGEEIGTYAKRELISKTYTVKAEGGDVYSDIGAAACDYNMEYWIDGVRQSAAYTDAQQNKLERRNDQQVGTTGNGVLTEVYVDTLDRETTIVEIHTYLAQATADYNATSKRLSISVYTGRDGAGNIESVSKRLEEDDLPAITKYKEDDFMMVTMADGEVKSVADPEVVSEASITAYESSASTGVAETDKRLTSVNTNGQEYEISEEAFYDPDYLFDYAADRQQLKDHTYNLMLDSYGYLLGLENVSDGTNFFFIVGYEQGSANWGKSIDKAYVIFPDGTTGTVNCKEKDPLVVADSEIINAWYTYSVDSDNIYEIRGLKERQFAETRTAKVDSEHDTMSTANSVDVTPPSHVYGNDKSVYISVDVAQVNTVWAIDDVNGVSTGLRNTSINMLNNGASTVGFKDQTTTFANVFGLFDKHGYVTHAIVLGDSGVGDFVYVASGLTRGELTSNGEYRYRFDAIVPGEDDVVTLWVDDSTHDDLAPHNLYKVARDSEGIITKAELQNTKSTFNTATYKNDGYTRLAVTAGSTQQFIEAGRTLKFPAPADNDRYILLAPDCTFFVNKTNRDGSKSSDYEFIGTTNGALTALGTDANGDHLLTSAAASTALFTAIADSNGQATTVIFYDYEYEDDTTPGGGDPRLNIAVGNGKITVTNWDGKDIDALGDAIVDVLERNGYTDVNVSIENGGITSVTARKGGRTNIFTLDGDIKPTVGASIGKMQDVLAGVEGKTGITTEIDGPTEATITGNNSTNLNNAVKTNTGMFNTLRSIDGFRKATFKINPSTNLGFLTPDNHDANNATLMSAIGSHTFANNETLVITIETDAGTIDYTINFKVGS